MPGKLTSNGIGNLKRLGKSYDGAYGLFLQVYPTGAKCWQQRLTISGRRRTLGLGGFPDVKLADARAAACENWLLVRAGGDPFGNVNGGVKPRINGEQRVAEATTCRVERQGVASRQAALRLLRCAPALRVTRRNPLTQLAFMAGSRLPAVNDPLCENTAIQKVNPHILCSPLFGAFGSPSTDKRPAGIPTFEQAAHAVIELHAPTWKDPTSARAWRNTLGQYVFPHFGKVRVSQVDIHHVLAALTPIWNTHPQTARRVRQRIRTILDWAIAKQYRTTNSAGPAIHGVLPKNRPVNKRTQHFAAVPYAELPQVLADVRHMNARVPLRLLFEFVVLTVVRSAEAREAQWTEINFDEAMWLRIGKITARSVSANEYAVRVGARTSEDPSFPGLSPDPFPATISPIVP